MANDTTFDDEYIKESAVRAEKSKQNTFDSWVVDLEKKEQPEACNIDDPDCIISGS